MLKPRIARYLLVGLTAFEMTALYGLHSMLRLSPVVSVAISFWVGFVIAFAGQKLFTFQDYDRRAHIVATQIIGYSLLVAWNYGITLVAVKQFSSVLSVFAIRSIVIIVVTGWNYIIYRRLFKTKQFI